jgi:hypothetical protein
MIRAAVLAAVLLGAVACAPRPVVERAIAARGGAVAGLVRDSDVQVAMGFPGAWQWRTVTALPDRYAWSITTNDQPHHYLFDGTEVRAFIGTALVSEDSTASALKTHARFVAVANLDVLRLPGVQVEQTGATLTAVFPDRGDRYQIHLDANGLVTSVEGPIDLSPIAKGTLHAAYDDIRPVDGRQLPHHIHYDLDGHPLADEQVRRTCILRDGAPASAFSSPTTLPACDG